jgi:hypothetical protein
MSRPSTHADLEDYRTQGHTLFNWYSDLAKHPAIEQHIVKAKIEALRLGFEVTTTEVRVPQTEAELDEKLRDQQERYDKGCELYAELLAGPRYFADLTYTEKNRAEYYAEREGITSPSSLTKLSFERNDLETEEV